MHTERVLSVLSALVGYSTSLSSWHRKIVKVDISPTAEPLANSASIQAYHLVGRLVAAMGDPSTRQCVCH